MLIFLGTNGGLKSAVDVNCHHQTDKGIFKMDINIVYVIATLYAVHLNINSCSTVFVC